MVKNMDKRKIQEKINTSKDYIFKSIHVDNQEISFLFNETLTDGEFINEYILEPIHFLSKEELLYLDNFLPDRNISLIDESEIFSKVNMGFFIIFINQKIYGIEAKARLDRGITTVEGEVSITGPKDAFSENFITNLGLIRRRIKTTDLISETMEIGRKSKTKVGILYIKGIAKKKLVKEIQNNISKIDLDGIIDSSYLKRTLEVRKSIFPTIMMTERPDKASMALLEGKVVIIVDMSPYVLLLPSFFIDFFHTTDDYYQKPENISFIRIIRLIAFLISIFLPAIYIAITTRNYNLVPLDLLFMLKAGRSFVPFPAFLEALFMILCFEILKESDLRMSSTNGSAVSILGGLILGDAAVSAMIVSPIMIIVIAISSIAGFVFNSIELVNATRIYKIILLLLASLFGIYGIIIGSILLLYNLRSLKPFGIPYTSPFFPFVKEELHDTFTRSEKDIKTRNPFLSNNKVRGRYK